MTTTVNTYRVEETNHSAYVLLQRLTDTNTTLWVFYCERNGKEMQGTRVVRRRLSKEARRFYNVI